MIFRPCAKCGSPDYSNSSCDACNQMSAALFKNSTVSRTLAAATSGRWIAENSTRAVRNGEVAPQVDTPTLKECLDWLNGQIAFKPDHPNWEIVMTIVAQLEAGRKCAEALKPYAALMDGDQAKSALTQATATGLIDEVKK